MSILFGLLPALVVVALLALVIVWANRRHAAGAGAGGDPHPIRRFFQYLLLFGLLVVAAIGTSNLLARLFGSTTRAPGPSPYPGGPDPALLLAQDLAFSIVGIPLVALIAAWTWRSHRRDPEESRSGVYAVHATLMALVALLVSALALQALVGAAAYRPHLDADAAGRFIVWGAIWVAYWLLARRSLPAVHRGPHLVLGSMVGLVLVTLGFVRLVGTSLDMLVRPGEVIGIGGQLAGALGLFLAGALVWVRYWVTATAREPRTPLWLLHVLVLGVGGGLVLALLGASLLLWDTLVWFVGDPGQTTARLHFAGATSQFAAVLAGALVWWYHRSALAHGGTTGRTEVQRVYEYLVSAIGLGATAAGVGTVLVALIESVTPGVDVGMSVRNTLLSAVTLLVVGIPVWLTFWLAIRRKVAADPPAEVASRTRRIYLALLFGLAGVAAAIALIIVAIGLMQDVVVSQVSGATLRSMRYGLGVLVAAAAVSTYHGTVWREDRTIAPVPPVPAEAAPRWIILVGPAAPDLVRDVEQATGAHVELWSTAGEVGHWDREALVAALAEHTGPSALVLAQDGPPQVLDVSMAGRPLD
ncbi:hypothetical protein GA0111570_103247 [Raineyella antarctica]|uniref:DUF5671 domain-containing protein n=1 Tax=Raineyella antarctica TaxID=1577474 RepID=A0A1G6GHE9_9ACTN|nr:DUF5671 domain-containing protein [Raineyella antarctica]SDB81263.1 hypothetical protein GA0111570_103247 [Raineyella antarctica]